MVFNTHLPYERSWIIIIETGNHEYQPVKIGVSTQHVKRKMHGQFYDTLKPVLSPLHEIRGFQIGVWTQGLSSNLLMYIKERCMNNLCDPRVYSIVHAKNPRVLDGHSNERLLIGPYECIMDNKQWNDAPLNLINEFTTSTSLRVINSL